VISWCRSTHALDNLTPTRKRSDGRLYLAERVGLDQLAMIHSALPQSWRDLIGGISDILVGRSHVLVCNAYAPPVMSCMKNEINRLLITSTISPASLHILAHSSRLVTLHRLLWVSLNTPEFYIRSIAHHICQFPLTNSLGAFKMSFMQKTIALVALAALAEPIIAQW